MWEIVVLYLMCGAFAGIAAGLFGVGGGLIVVPFLAWLFPVQGVPERLVMLMAVATSLSTIVVTSVSSVLAHHRLGAIRWKAVWRLLPGIIFGALLGAVIAERLPVPAFRLLFGVFLLAVSLRMFRRASARRSSKSQVSMPEFIAAGGVIGLMSSILGIGGGTLSVPYLVKRGFVMRNAVAISSVCGFPIAVVGTATYIVLGWNNAALPPLTLGYVHVPGFIGITVASVPFAPLGAKIAHKLPSIRLKRAFAMVLLAVGARLLWQGISLLHVPLTQISV